MLHGKYVGYIPSLVAVACFLPGRAKDFQHSLVLVIGKRQYLEGRIAYEGLRFDVHETVTGEVHCLKLALSQEGFLIDTVDVVPGCIQLYKRNYP